jgi:hypothetical protein
MKLKQAILASILDVNLRRSSSSHSSLAKKLSHMAHGLVLHPFRLPTRNRRASRLEMVGAVVQVGAAVCGDHLCHPRELAVD